MKTEPATRVEPEPAPSDANPPSNDRWTRSTLIVITIAVLARIPLVFRAITYRGDIWRQTDTATIARNFIRDANLFFPRINWGGAGPGFVEAELQLFPWTVSRLYRLFGEHVWFGRAIALLLSAGTLLYFARLASRLVNRRAALVAVVFFALSPEFIRYSTAFMPEAAALFAYVAALYYFDQWIERHTWRLALACGAFSALAALVKPTTLHLGLIFAAVLLMRHGYKSLFERQSLVIALIVVVPVGLWMAHAAQLHHDYGNTFGVISGGDRKFGGLSFWTSGAFYSGTSSIDLRWVFGFVGIAPAAFGLAVALRRRIDVVLAGVAAIVVYYFVVARYVEGELGIQYHLYTVVFAALLIGLGSDAFLNRYAGAPRSNRSRVLAVAAASAVALAFVGVGVASFADQFHNYGESAVSCGNEIRAVVPPDDLVVISSGDSAKIGGVTNNYQDPTLFYFGDRRGWSLAADQHAPGVLDGYRQEGAKWFIIDDRDRLMAHPALVSYLGSDVQLGSGFSPSSSSGCAIYRLEG